MEYPDMTVDNTSLEVSLADLAPQVPAHPYAGGTPRLDFSAHAHLWLRNADLIREAVAEMMHDGCSDEEIRRAFEHAMLDSRREYVLQFKGSSENELAEWLEESRANNLGA